MNTRVMTISLPESKVNAIQKEVSLLLSAETVQIRKPAHVIGMLVATKAVVHTAPLHFCALQHLQITSLHKLQSYQARVQLSLANLQWWKDHLWDNCLTPTGRICGKSAGMGSCLQGGEDWSQVDCNRGTTSHQCVGVEGSTIGNPVFLEREDRHSNFVLIRMNSRAAIAHINKMRGPIFISPVSDDPGALRWCLEYTSPCRALAR